MASTRVILITVLLAVGASAKNKIRISPFVSLNCEGITSDLPFEIEQSECKDVNLQSVHFSHPIRKKDWSGWVEEIERGNQECFVKLYKKPNCRSNNVPEDEEVVPMPQSMEACWTPFGNSPFMSMMFICKDLHYTLTETATKTYTSWPTNEKGSHTPVPYTTKSQVIKATNGAQRVVRSMVPRAWDGERGSHAMESGVAYAHPWTGGRMCYDCWPENTNNPGGKFKCYSPAQNDCPSLRKTTTTIFQSSTPKPAKETTTTIFEEDYDSPDTDDDDDKDWADEVVVFVETGVTKTVTQAPGATRTVTYIDAVTTVTVVDEGKTSTRTVTRKVRPTGIDNGRNARGVNTTLEARGHKRHVFLTHPFAKLQVCAKADWKKNGKNRNDVVLTGPKRAHLCKNSQSIDA